MKEHNQKSVVRDVTTFSIVISSDKFISVFVESSQGYQFYNQTRGVDDIYKDAAQHETFLEVSSDIVRRRVSNS